MNVLRIILILVLGFFAIGLAFSLIKGILGLIIPALILVALGYGIYNLAQPNSLGGGGRSLP